MRKSLMKGIIIFGVVLTAVIMSAVSLQAQQKVPIIIPLSTGDKVVGDAVAADVLSGKTFSSEAAGIGITGTADFTGNTCTGDAVATDVRDGKIFSSEAAGIGATGTADFTACPGDAVAADVKSGKTFSSDAGIELTGTLDVTGTGTCTEAPVRQTGQVSCWNGTNWITPCSSPNPAGQDGALTPGVAWPATRFTDNTDGTVTDELTGLIWLKDADCYLGAINWSEASDFVNGVISSGNGDCVLPNGDWRIPTVDELISLLDREYAGPSLSNAQGTEKWTDGNVFNNVRSDKKYWTSTVYAPTVGAYPIVDVWTVSLNTGEVGGASQSNTNYVWAVRDAN